MAGLRELRFLFGCVVLASVSCGQSGGGIGDVISHIETLQARLAKAERDAAGLVSQLQSVNIELQLLSTNITELGECDKITCPEGYVMPCGDMCYRLYNGTECSDDGGLYTVPMSQTHIDCVLALTEDSTLPVVTYYGNVNGANFTNLYFTDSSVVAPPELIGSELGPGGDVYTEGYVIIHRISGQLVRSGNLGDSGWARVCEKRTLE